MEGLIYDDGIPCVRDAASLLKNKGSTEPTPDGGGGIGGLLYLSSETQPPIFAALERQLSDGSHFLTSPNDKYHLYYPTNTNIDVYLRANGMFANADPILWPQRLINDNFHLACIPRCASGAYADHPKMFWFQCPIENESDFFERTALSGPMEYGVLGSAFEVPISKSVAWLEERVRKLRNEGFTRDKPHRETFIHSSLCSLNVCLRRVHLPASYSEIRHWTVGISRFWLYLNAWLDYLLYIRATTRATYLRSVIGCFTDSLTTVLFCQQLGIPVYYIQPAWAVGNLHIKEVVEVIGAWQLDVMGMFELDSATRWGGIRLYQGDSASGQHIKAIDATYRYDSPSHQPLQQASSPSNDTQLPLPNVIYIPVPVYPPPHVQNSEPSPAFMPNQPGRNVGPIRSQTNSQKSMQTIRKGTKTKVHKEGSRQQSERDKFADFEGDMAPAGIPCWRAANKTLLIVHQDQPLDLHPEYHGDIHRSRYTFPDPGLLLAASDFRRVMYITQWLHLSPYFMTFFAANTHHLVSESTKGEQWRAMLSLPYRLSDVYPEVVEGVKSKSEQEFSEARETLATIMSVSVDPGSSVPHSLFTPQSLLPPDKWTLELLQIRRAIWQVSELNFRCELLRLHRYLSPYGLDPTKPAEPYQVADHTNALIQELEPVFFRDDHAQEWWFLNVSYANARKGLADPVWSERLPYLLAFHRLMQGWDTPRGKPPFFEVTDFKGQPQPEWELALVRYYVQTWFDFSLRPAILPKTLGEEDIGDAAMEP